MKIILPDETIELASASTQDKLDQINRILAQLFDRHEIVSEVVINGHTVREDYSAYLLRHLDQLDVIEIHTVHGDKWIADTVAELSAYLPRLLKGLDSISDLFYKEPSQEEWGYFAQLTEGMEWVVQSVQAILEQQERMTNGRATAWTEALAGFVTQFAETLNLLEEALGQRDYVAGADIMKYELPPLYEQLSDSLKAGSPS